TARQGILRARLRGAQFGLEIPATPVSASLPQGTGQEHLQFLAGKTNQTRCKPEDRQKDSQRVSDHGAAARRHDNSLDRLSNVDLREALVHPVSVFDSDARAGRAAGTLRV